MLAAGAAIMWNGTQDRRALDLELAGIAAAMGAQNIALAGSVLRAHTTHITGPVTDFAGTLVRRLIGRRSLARDVSHGLAVYAAVWSPLRQASRAARCCSTGRARRDCSSRPSRARAWAPSCGTSRGRRAARPGSIDSVAGQTRGHGRLAG